MIILKHKEFKKWFFSFPLFRRALSLIPDSVYIPMMYFLQTGNILSLKNPRTYCDKLQWLKLYGDYEKLTDYADKIAAKVIAQEMIGEAHVIPTLGIWDRYEDIDFDSLPDRFVLKCTHDSGGNYVCHDKNKISHKELARFFENRLSVNYYWYLRECQYKNIVPRIIAEPLMSNDGDLVDYKFFCFNGSVEILMVVHIVNGKRFSSYFDGELRPIDISMGNPSYPAETILPVNIQEMRRMAQVLSANLRHVRIDMYNIDGNIYFGEFTFHHWSGMVDVRPTAFSLRLGEMIDCSWKRDNYGPSAKM